MSKVDRAGHNPRHPMTWTLPKDNKTVDVTSRGLRVTRTSTALTGPFDIAALAARLDTRRGALFSSQTEVPGRYSRHDLGFADPPIAIEGRGRAFSIAALNARGEILLAYIDAHLTDPRLTVTARSAQRIDGDVIEEPASDDEAQRTKRASLFTLLRALKDMFALEDEGNLGLLGGTFDAIE